MIYCQLRAFDETYRQLPHVYCKGLPRNRSYLLVTMTLPLFLLVCLSLLFSPYLILFLFISLPFCIGPLEAPPSYHDALVMDRPSTPSRQRTQSDASQLSTGVRLVRQSALPDGADPARHSVAEVSGSNVSGTRQLSSPLGVVTEQPRSGPVPLSARVASLAAGRTDDEDMPHQDVLVRGSCKRCGRSCGRRCALCLDCSYSNCYCCEDSSACARCWNSELMTSFRREICIREDRLNCWDKCCEATFAFNANSGAALSGTSQDKSYYYIACSVLGLCIAVLLFFVFSPILLLLLMFYYCCCRG